MKPALRFMLCALIVLVGALVWIELGRRWRCQHPPIWVYEGLEDGPVWLFLGTVHGNEPAGGVALEVLRRCLDDGRLRLQCGRLSLVPRGNPCGAELGIRWSPTERGRAMDLNRVYNGPTPEGEFGRYLWTARGGLRDVDGVLDLHEGWGYHFENGASVGSSLQATGEEARRHARVLVVGLNERLPPSARYPFAWIGRPPQIAGSMLDWCYRYGRQSILVETSGQNNIQPLAVRAAQHLYAAWELGRRLGFWVDPVPAREVLEEWCGAR